MAVRAPALSVGRQPPTALRVRLAGTGTLVAAGVAAAAVGFSFARFGLGFAGFETAFAAAVLVALGAVDLDRHVIPNRVVLPAASLLAVAVLLHDPAAGAGRLAWAAGAFAAFLLLALVYPAGLGMGDVKLALFLGLALGGAVITALVLGLLAAALVSLGVLARYGPAGRKVAIPLGTFLAVGALVALLGT